ncbi:TetR/AcrR family transcriptional regulator [Phytoactinopolyspora alkaliphila]|uniref:TetR/AcrR family transcriptional regulator n=1 Tax=Phytoactinopolyspora alkaliphila TaxID=1783498 RepID=A0A6N9YNU6_9ACTN|nr:TetR/AcrR family transcriptional regulator [Phytoactinopolyspora alkaliphila]NED96716.1 TetR/AcrR family transcriptional regulator [Phytoactinopolyspora alkaliphila]
MKQGVARDRLLVAAIEYVAQHGIRERSLREIASALGTSHRMLIYHFGSKEGLLTEVVRAMESQQRAVFDELADDDAAPAEVARAFWRRLAHPDLWPHERLFFEMYGRAVQGDPGAAAILDGLIDPWIEPLAASLARAGFTVEDARVHARLGLAVARGLLLDLLATGDRAAADDAMELFISRYDPPSP